MLKNFQIGPLWADWQTPEYVPNSHLYSKYLWKIAGHKYRRGAWNLPHKFHLYLISIFFFRHTLSDEQGKVVNFQGNCHQWMNFLIALVLVR